MRSEPLHAIYFQNEFVNSSFTTWDGDLDATVAVNINNLPDVGRVKNVTVKTEQFRGVDGSQRIGLVVTSYVKIEENSDVQ